MTPKERMLAAFHHQQQDDEIPAWELEFQLYPEMFGRDLIVGYEFEKLSAAEKEAAIIYNVEFMIEVAETLGYCAIRGLPEYWEISPGEAAYLWLGEDKYRKMLLKELVQRAGDRFMIIGDACGLIGIPAGDRIMEFVDEMYDDPEGLKVRADKNINAAIEEGYRLMDLGVDCIFNLCDCAYNSGTFLSPDQFDEFVTPYMYRFGQTFKKEGIPTMFHSDGNLMGVLDRIVDAGFTALQCVDPLAGMDIVQLKKDLAGKLCLVGNIDCARLQVGTPEEIDGMVKHVVENCKEGGGFVLSGCNVIFKGIPVENYQAMVQARRKYGRFI